MNVCVYVAEPPVGKWEKWENGHFVRESSEKVGRFVFSLILHDGIMGKAPKMTHLSYNKMQSVKLPCLKNNGEKYGYPRKDTKYDERIERFLDSEE